MNLSKDALRSCLATATGKPNAVLLPGQYEAACAIFSDPAVTVLRGRTGSGKSALVFALALLSAIDQDSELRNHPSSSLSKLSLYVSPTIALLHSLHENTGLAGESSGVRFFGGGLGYNWQPNRDLTTLVVTTPDQLFHNLHLCDFISRHVLTFVAYDEIDTLFRHSSFRVFVKLLPRKLLKLSRGRAASITVLASATIAPSDEERILKYAFPQYPLAIVPRSLTTLQAPPSGLVVQVKKMEFSFPHLDSNALRMRFASLNSYVLEAGISKLATIIFCAERLHCSRLAASVNGKCVGAGLNISSFIYTGATTASQRQNITTIVNSPAQPGRINVVFATEALVFGADLKSIGFVGILMPLRNVAAMRQAVGRVGHAGRLQFNSNLRQANALMLYGVDDFSAHRQVVDEKHWRLPSLKACQGSIFPVLQLVESLVARARENTTRLGKQIEFFMSSSESTVLSTGAAALASKSDSNSSMSFSRKNQLLSYLCHVLSPFLGGLVEFSARFMTVAGFGPTFIKPKAVPGSISSHRDKAFCAYFKQCALQAKDGPRVLNTSEQNELGRTFARAYAELACEIGKLFADVPSQGSAARARIVNVPVSTIRQISLNALRERPSLGVAGAVRCTDSVGCDDLVADLIKALERRSTGPLPRLRLGLSRRLAKVTIVPLACSLTSLTPNSLFAKVKCVLRQQRDNEDREYNEVERFLHENTSGCSLQAFENMFGVESTEDLRNCFCENCH